MYKNEEKTNHFNDIQIFNTPSKNLYLSITNANKPNENYSFYDSALSSLNDLTSLNNLDNSFERNKGNSKKPSIQSQSFNKLISSFTTPKQSKIPILLSKSMSECHKNKREHFESVLVKSSYNNNDISLGSCEQLTEIQLSPSIKAQNLLKACREKKVIPITKYSKPSLIVPLKRDVSFYQNNITSKNCNTNSYYFNEHSSGLGSSIITTQSLFDDSEDKEVKDYVDKYMAFTKMRHSLKIYRNKMGGFDEEFYKKVNWLFLSSRGPCRMCKHIPSFIINYGKIKKPNVVKRRPCICKKLQSINDIGNSNIYGNKLMFNIEITLLQQNFLILLIPGVIAFFIETFFSLISIF